MTGITSALPEAATWLLIIALIYLLYRHDQRKQQREADQAARWRLDRERRYRQLEFDVSPPVYDQERDAA